MVGNGKFAPFESVEGMDAELARLSRSDGALRLGLGTGFEALAQKSGHHELGFSSLEAYALERCERSARWVQQSRHLARGLGELPAIRNALLTGELSWSMASLLANEATRDDEVQWLAEARGRTLREMRDRSKALRRLSAGGQTETAGLGETTDGLGADEEFCMLTVTVDREDAWLFECVRMIVGCVSEGRTEDDVVEALLAEGFSTLSRWLSKEAIGEPEEDPTNAAQRAWEAELARWREQAETMCEPRVRERMRHGERERDHDFAMDFNFEGSIDQIDGELQRLAADLATRDVAIGRLAERFWKADGWRRLGFATESQYARERLGMSLSAVKAKRRLARGVERLPRLARALDDRELGYEAARVVAQVATLATVDQWIARATERTVRCLRDEADAADMLARLAGDKAIEPPDEELMNEIERVESAVVSGAAFKGDPGQISAASPKATGRPKSPTRALGRVTLRLRVRADTRWFYRWLERLYARYGRSRVSFLCFLCSVFIETWQSALGSDVAYASVYARDRYRCTCPVCGRRDVQPHHLKFRSRGGEDVDENVASLCTWCHLDGIHGGRLVATPPASAIRWSIGRTPHTIVEGRRRVRVEAS